MECGIRYHQQDPRNHHQLSPSNLAERDALHHNTHLEECLLSRVLKRRPRKVGKRVEKGNQTSRLLTVELAVAKSVFSKKI